MQKAFNPPLSAGQDSSEQPHRLNWGGKEAAGKGERGSHYGASQSLIGKGKAWSQKRLLIVHFCICVVVIFHYNHILEQRVVISCFFPLLLL